MVGFALMMMFKGFMYDQDDHDGGTYARGGRLIRLTLVAILVISVKLVTEVKQYQYCDYYYHFC